MLTTIRRLFSSLSSEAYRTSRTTKTKPLGLETLEARLTPSSSWITNASTYPARAVVHLDVTFADGTRSTGTGSMIDRFHVLTAGHMVYASKHGGWARSIDVEAGMTSSTQYYAYARATLMRTFSSFISFAQQTGDLTSGSGNGDIGVITLDRTLGDRTGWFGYSYASNESAYRGLAAEKMGYPGQPYDGYHMMYDWGNLTGTTAPQNNNGFNSVSWSLSSMTSMHGQSGSGVRHGNTIYAVLDTGDTYSGYAELITQMVYNNIVSWCGADRTPSANVDHSGLRGIAVTTHGVKSTPVRTSIPHSDELASGGVVDMTRSETASVGASVVLAVPPADLVVLNALVTGHLAEKETSMVIVPEQREETAAVDAVFSQGL